MTHNTIKPQDSETHVTSELFFLLTDSFKDMKEPVESEQSDNMIPDNVVHTCGFGAPATGYRSLTGLQAPVTLCTLSYKIEFLNSLQ